ncbi:AAA family ATPase [Chitinimonas sp.]|uniref:AAA family ATPase n=1 Tax=Chitinimonas sp. TaxID=1934313 RepID=UPI0035AE1FC4
MFQFRKLEMRNWDFWQSIEVPLDAQIVTIVGPNGSGKTTLLDALRTLLAQRCSGRRDYKRYVRNSTEPVAWLRGVVDNPRREGGGLFPYPFFPITADKVTLFCRVKKQGGDWARHYAIAEGEVELLPETEEQLRWLGVNEYKMALEQAGLTRAIAEVLALEQGDTDKLCEYSPKALLDLVFQVFGDKQVLDHYQQAKVEQRAAEQELAELERNLDGLGGKVEQMKGRANRHLEWRGLQDEVEQLEKTVLPGLRYLEAWDSLAGYMRQYKGQRRLLRQKQDELAVADASYYRLHSSAEALVAGDGDAKQAYDRLWEQFRKAGDEARDAERVLAQRDKLTALAEAESGADGVGLADTLGRLRDSKNELDARIKSAKEERQQLSELQFALQGGRQPAEPFVRQMRAALDEAGIAHQLLTEIVEVRDNSWQEAVEALLSPYRHIILLNREADKAEAFRIGQRLQYRHFIVPDREACPRAVPGSVLEVLDFKAEAPGWLSRQLNNVQRVKSVEAGASVQGDWITREGYHKERRGARHIGVNPRDHAFGEAARLSRLDELTRRLREINQQILDWEGESVELGRQIASLQLQLAGMDAVQQLAARRDEFGAAQAALPELQAQAQRLGGELADAQAAMEQQRKEGEGLRMARREAELARDALNRDVINLLRETDSRRAEQTRKIGEAREIRASLIEQGVQPHKLVGLKEEWGSIQAVRHEIERQSQRIEQGDWERDASVLELRDKIQQDYDALAGETSARAREVARARELTDDARGAYISKLRATVRAYAANVKRLGELSGIHVEVDMPQFENDDAVLAQAGLTVRFDFDQKGMMGLNDGEASGGQQVMKSLILLIGLMMDEANPSGFVFIDEPFAHLDVLNIDKVGAFLKATQAQYLITTPLTHNLNAFAPSELTLCTYKKRPSERWAPVITQTRRRR